MITVDFQRLTLGPDSRVLDIGCGNGRHTAAAFDLGIGRVVGADRNPDDLKEAHARLCLHASINGRPQSDWLLAGADITCLPFGADSFDLVICSEVLEHIHDHHTAIRELHRVLKPDGQLVVSVPRRWPETLCWALSRQYRQTPGGHVRIYDHKRLTGMIEQATGMAHWHTHYAHGLHAPYWWLKCLLGLERDQRWPVRQYHRLLTWDMMQQPPLTRTLERWLDPVMGKSVVLYFQRT